MAWIGQRQRLPRYHLINERDDNATGYKETKQDVFMMARRLARQSGVLLVLGVVLILVPITVLCTKTLNLWGAATPNHQVPFPVNAADARGARDRRIVVVMAANHGHVNLCKTILSAMAVGYPSPVIVNWGQVYDDNDPRSLGGLDLAKISGPLDYLDTATLESTHAADRLRHDDLILLVDAFDTWFQLPPEVLIHRYHKAIKAADAHLLEQWSDSQQESNDMTIPMPMKQTIVVSPQKRCWSGVTSGSDLHCGAVPESTARKDLYGPKTDKDPENDVTRVRAKFLDGGAMMGPVGDIRRYLRRAKQKMEMHYANGQLSSSDQAVFGETWAEQEVWRSWMKQQSWKNDSMEAISQSTFEFHVGLNYDEDLFIATLFHEEDGDVLMLDDTARVQQESERRDIRPVRFEGVPADVAHIPHPVKVIAAAGQKTEMESGNLEWGDMNMYVDFFTGKVPAIVHHNAHADELKERRFTWWGMTWYYPHLRDLIKAHLKPGSLRPLATVRLLEEGESQVTVTYTAPASEEYRRRPRIFRFEDRGEGWREGGMSDICSNPDAEKEKQERWFDEVFRDGQGPLV